MSQVPAISILNYFFSADLLSEIGEPYKCLIFFGGGGVDRKP